MAYKTRKSLADKMEAAFSVAAKKEGREITMDRFSSGKLNPKEIAYRSRDGILLYDGRYITRFWDGNGYPRMAVSNLPVSTLRCLVDGDHDVETQNERNEVHEDFEYQNYLKKEGTDTPNIVNPIDRSAYQSNFGNPEDIVIRKLCPEKRRCLPVIDLAALANDPHIGFMPSGRFDDEMRAQIKAIAHAFLKSLPPDKRKDCIFLFTTTLMQKEIAEMEGVSEAAISKRKRKYIDKLAAIFHKHGYPVITKDEKKQETEQRQSYEDHYKAVSGALKDLYCPEEEETEEAETIA